MPFRSFRKDIEPGAPVRLFTAEADDVWIEVRAAALSDDNMSVGFSFRVGGPDMATTGGLVCFDSEWSSEVAEGDEVWVQTYGAAFTNTTPITAMVRSARVVESSGDAKAVRRSDSDDSAPPSEAVRSAGGTGPADAAGRRSDRVAGQPASRVRRQMQPAARRV